MAPWTPMSAMRTREGRMGEGQITAATTATRNQLTSTYLKATTIDTTAAALLDTSSRGQAPATRPPRAPTLTTATLGRDNRSQINHQKKCLTVVSCLEIWSSSKSIGDQVQDQEATM